MFAAVIRLVTCCSVVSCAVSVTVLYSLSDRKSARPKSLAISTPTKLLSLEEARQKAVASCLTERQQVYLDVGGGPANLPPVYHTVIDLPKGFV